MVWKECQHCHGKGKVHVEVKPGKWEWHTCPACGGKGGTDTRNI